MCQKPSPVIPYEPSSSFHIKEHRSKRFQKIIFCIALALKAFVQTRQRALGHMQTLTFTQRWPWGGGGEGIQLVTDNYLQKLTTNSHGKMGGATVTMSLHNIRKLG